MTEEEARNFLCDCGFTTGGSRCTGYAFIDDLHFKLIDSSGGFSMRVCPKTTVYGKSEVKLKNLTIDEPPMLVSVPVTTKIHQWQHVVLEYPASVGEDVQKHFESVKAVVDDKAYGAVILTSQYEVIVYLRKLDKTKFDLPRLNGQLPCKLWQFSVQYRGVFGKHVLLQQLFKLAMVSVSDISYTKDEFTFDTLKDITKNLSEEQLNHIKGRFLAIPKKERTKEQQGFIESFPILLTYIPRSKQASKDDVFIFNVSDFKKSRLYINEFKDFIAGTLDRLKCSRLLEAASTNMKEDKWDTFSYMHLLKNLGMLQFFALLILGPVETTGYGKTQLAIFTAAMYAIFKMQLDNLPPEKCNICFISGNLDKAKSIDFQAQSVLFIIIDEFAVSDHHQVQHISEDMMKVLMDVGKPAGLRAKGCEEISLPAHVPRCILGQAANAMEYAGCRFNWSKPIQRKCIEVIVTERLLPLNHSADVAEKVTAINTTNKAMNEKSKDFFEALLKDSMAAQPSEPSAEP